MGNPLNNSDAFRSIQACPFRYSIPRLRLCRIMCKQSWRNFQVRKCRDIVMHPCPRNGWIGAREAIIPLKEDFSQKEHSPSRYYRLIIGDNQLECPTPFLPFTIDEPFGRDGMDGELPIEIFYLLCAGIAQHHLDTPSR